MARAFDVIAEQLADAQAQWSLGTFGAIAEFMRDADEPAEIRQGEGAISVVMPRASRCVSSRQARSVARTRRLARRARHCASDAEELDEHVA